MSNKSKTLFNPILWSNEINDHVLNKGKTFGRDLLLDIDRDYDHLD